MMVCTKQVEIVKLRLKIRDAQLQVMMVVQMEIVMI